MSHNSTGDGKGLEIYKSYSPLASGACQAPDFTYSHSAASTNHKCRTHKLIANTYYLVPVKHHNIPLPHIDQSRGVIVANNLTALNQNTHIHTPNIHCTRDKEGRECCLALVMSHPPLKGENGQWDHNTTSQYYIIN